MKLNICWPILLTIILISVFLLPGCLSNQPNIQEADRLFNESRFEEALTIYDEAIKVTPNDATLWIKRGATLDKLHRYPEAIESISKGVSINESIIHCEKSINICYLTVYPNKVYMSGVGEIRFSNNTNSYPDDALFCIDDKCLQDFEKTRN